LARARDQFRQSDVSFWGIVALASGGIALLTANISALVPDSVFAGLHATRLGGATVNEMHSELTNIEDEQARIRATSSELGSRFQSSERDATLVRQRVAALEVSVPTLTEALNTRPAIGIDPSLVTGSIGAAPQGFSKPMAQADSNAATVRVTQTPLLPATGRTASGSPAAPAATQGMPAGLSATPAGTAAAQTSGGAIKWATAALVASAAAPGRPAVTPRPDVIAEGAIPVVPAAQAAAAPAGTAKPLAVASTPTLAQPNVRAIGIAIGSPVQPAGALGAWQALAAKVGILLVGTSPLLAEDPAGSGGKVLVAGPIADVATAAKLCGEITGAGILCMPMPYVGGPLSPAAAQN
jgi:hypothetical protein